MKIYDYKGRKNLCGQKIRKIRLAKDLSQVDLAARIQVEELMLQSGSVSRIELGTRFVSDYELFVLAKILGVSMEELMELPQEEAYR